MGFKTPRLFILFSLTFTCFVLNTVTGQKRCFNAVVCDPGAISCRQHVRTSPDKLYLLTTVSCLDNTGNVVGQPFDKSEANPYPDYTTYDSTSFQGTATSYSNSPGNQNNYISYNINNNI